MSLFGRKHDRSEDESTTPTKTSKKQDLEETPMKQNYSNTDDDQASSFVEKVWPLLEVKMNSWIEGKLHSLVTTVATEDVTKLISSDDFQESLTEAIGLNEFKDDLMNEIEDKFGKSEQYSRQKNIRIGGIPEDDSEEREQTDGKVINLIKENLGITILPTDICRSHRTGKKKDSKPRQIVKFTRHNTKLEVMRKRKELKQKKSSIFINEDLTQQPRLKMKKTVITGTCHTFNSIEKTGKWRSNVNLSKYSKVLIPGQFDATNHWQVCVVDLDEGTIALVDPMSLETDMDSVVFNEMRQFLEKREGNKGKVEWRQKWIAHPLQTDCVSRGVFILKIAECLAWDMAISSTKDDVDEYRYVIAGRLITEKW
ncbi:predicted protein [Nematostella vectensis]|uniref:Ubiquitin-like protease family profile domain-containing protein n=1 Tax=Nematostella vectensis TaxID=45351 RepID=A7SIK6_NEMVE|nr:predicted protein [Nematostella vectensis]|eukprot:XP_001628551.1 predicted protein [Nematostella vectensis]